MVSLRSATTRVKSRRCQDSIEEFSLYQMRSRPGDRVDGSLPPGGQPRATGAGTRS